MDNIETILVVDSNMVLLDLDREILTLLGYEVLTASSGEEAVEIHASTDKYIPLAMLDMAVQGIDVLDTIRVLRSRDPAIRTIISSVLHPSTKVLSQFEEEVDAFILKPYGIDRLDREVRRLLDERSKETA